MCVTDVKLMNVVEAEVLKRMQANESFTALDVSNALKQARYPFRHREVAEAVRDIHSAGAMGSFGYKRELITVLTDNGTTPVTAALYLPHHANANDYADRSQNALSPVPAHEARDLTDCVAAGPLGVLASRRHYSTSGFVRMRSQKRRDGALAISRHLLAELGWNEGDQLALEIDAEGLRITASPSSQGLALLRVWADTRLRVSKTRLRLGSLSADRIAVELDGSSLRLKPGP